MLLLESIPFQVAALLGMRRQAEKMIRELGQRLHKLTHANVLSSGWLERECTQASATGHKTTAPPNSIPPGTQQSCTFRDNPAQRTTCKSNQ